MATPKPPPLVGRFTSASNRQPGKVDHSSEPRELTRDDLWTASIEGHPRGHKFVIRFIYGTVMEVVAPDAATAKFVYNVLTRVAVVGAKELDTYGREVKAVAKEPKR